MSAKTGPASFPRAILTNSQDSSARGKRTRTFRGSSAPGGFSSASPRPRGDLRRVEPVFPDKEAVVPDLPFVPDHQGFRFRGHPRVAGRNFPRRLDHQVIPAGAVADLHVEGRGGGALLQVAVDVEPGILR